MTPATRTPSPTSLAGLRKARPTPAPRTTAEEVPAGVVYSSRTGDPPGPEPSNPDDAVAEAIDEACRGVLATWLPRASADARQELSSGRNYIPSDIDRALLIDLSTKLGVYDIEEDTRWLLRERFWVHVDDALDTAETTRD